MTDFIMAPVKSRRIDYFYKKRNFPLIAGIK